MIVTASGFSLKDIVPQDRVAQDCSLEEPVLEEPVLEARLLEERLLEERLLAKRKPDGSGPEVRVPEICVPEICGPETGVPEIRGPEIRGPEIRVLQEQARSEREAPTNADPRRAMDALDWAVERAERQDADEEIANAEGPLAESPLARSPFARSHLGTNPPLVVTASLLDYQAAAEAFGDDMRRRLDQIMMSRDAETGLDALLEAGALKALFPEVSAMVGFGDGEWRHKDVWKHTKQVVRQAVPRIEIRWAALLHDIGKIKTRSISPSGEVHFFGHAEVGARMFDKLNRRLPLFRKEAALKDTVRFLILHHLRASQYDATWTDSAVRRFAREMGPLLDDLLCLSRADITTKRPEKKKKGLRQISELQDRVRTLAEEDAIVAPLPSGIGDELMKAFGLPPSRLVGEMKRALEKAVEDGSLEGRQPADFYVKFVSENRGRFGLKV